MLSPRSRRLLLDGLRPPAGYSLDRAVGTSYSLDLLALMTAPLAFTFFDWEDQEGRSSADPLALFEALRRHADRIALFCQAGRIMVPPTGRLLLHYLESSVFEAAAPREGGLFHPKVWLLRYTSAGEPVRYRLLCLTRNLTFDRSWDTALVLDGTLSGRKNAYSANHPLGDFIAALPELAVRPVLPETQSAIGVMAAEVRKVAFELPDGFDELAFHPLGIAGKPAWPFPVGVSSRRMLVISPFLGDGFLEQIAADRKPGVLISRPESLEALGPATLPWFDEVFVLHPGTDREDEDEAASDAIAPAGDPAEERVDPSLSGLHAKLFVLDDGWNARIWTGSANATDAAFARNVEFLVELVGKKRTCGIDALLGDADENGAALRSLLLPFTPPEHPAEHDDEAENLELEVERIATSIGGLGLVARAVERDGRFSLVLSSTGAWPALPPELRLTCRPVTLPTGAAVVVQRNTGPIAHFESLTVEALTQFFAFEIALRRGKHEKVMRFVVNVPLQGAPADRRDRVLRELLRDSKQVLRLIWLLLSDAEVSVQDWVDAGSGGGSRPWRSTDSGGFPILETMLKALARDPSKLDEVARLVGDLKRTPEGLELLPVGFDEIWEPIWAIREEVK